MFHVRYASMFSPLSLGILQQSSFHHDKTRTNIVAEIKYGIMRSFSRIDCIG